MNKQKKLHLKEVFLYLMVSTFIILSVSPLKAQVKRDHRTENKEAKKSDYRTTKKTVVNNQTLNFDEADAIFGTRTELQRKYPGIKFTGKIDRIIITKKLSDGENYIHKTTSGNTVYANVKKGKIIDLSLKKINFGTISDGSSNTVMFKDSNKPTCFKCTEICFDPDGTGALTCWTTSVRVDCSKDYNARIQGPLVPITKPPPPVGPIPIPYPNHFKVKQD